MPSGDTVLRYDLVLAVVPLALLLGAAALVAALAVGDALCRNPPGTCGAASR